MKIEMQSALIQAAATIITGIGAVIGIWLTIRANRIQNIENKRKEADLDINSEAFRNLLMLAYYSKPMDKSDYKRFNQSMADLMLIADNDIQTLLNMIVSELKHDNKFVKKEERTSTGKLLELLNKRYRKAVDLPHHDSSPPYLYLK